MPRLPSHNPSTWTQQKCFHMELLYGREGSCRGTAREESHSPHGRAMVCPVFDLCWRMAQHLPALCDDSQELRADRNVPHPAGTGGFFSPEPGFPSSQWFAGPTCNMLQREIYHRYRSHPSLPTIQLSLCRLQGTAAFFPFQIKFKHQLLIYLLIHQLLFSNTKYISPQEAFILTGNTIPRGGYV